MGINDHWERHQGSQQETGAVSRAPCAQTGFDSFGQEVPWWSQHVLLLHTDGKNQGCPQGEESLDGKIPGCPQGEALMDRENRGYPRGEGSGGAEQRRWHQRVPSDVQHWGSPSASRLLKAPQGP